MRRIRTALCVALALGFLSHEQATAEMTNTEKVSPSLLEKASERGLVRVIVTVDHATGADPGAGTDCENVDCIKLGIANAMLTTEAPVIEMLPGDMMVMEATHEGLSLLQRLPQVVSVAEDGIDEPHEAVPGVDEPHSPSPGLDAPTDG